MPHLTVLYTSDLEDDGDIAGLCRKLADTLLGQRDESGSPVFPPGGTRVFACASNHEAVSDGGVADRVAGGHGDLGFVYVNLRMGRGRSAAVQRAAGDALLGVASAHLQPVMARRRVGLTLQIDESPGQVYDGKAGNLHDLFRK